MIKFIEYFHHIIYIIYSYRVTKYYFFKKCISWFYSFVYIILEGFFVLYIPNYMHIFIIIY